MPSSQIRYELARIEDAAAEIASGLHVGQTVVLNGGLGMGKTTFVRSLVKALGLADEVTSPTYVLQHVYGTTNSLKVEHWDLYRLNLLPEELYDQAPTDTIRLIEWGEKFPSLLSNAQHILTFTVPHEDPLSELRLIEWEKVV